MITNATITAIAAPAYTPGGVESWPTAVPKSIRCLIDQPTRAQRVSLQNVLTDTALVAYVDHHLLSDGEVGLRYQVEVAIDDGSPRSLVCVSVSEFVKAGGLSHWLLVLEVAR